MKNLPSIMRPECVAVVGASDRLGSVGQAVYANLKSAKFAGRLIPINLQHTHIQGDQAWTSLNDVPVRPDLVVVCTPAITVPQIAKTCGERNIPGMIVISAGFREAGEAGKRLEAELRDVLYQFPLLRMMGPNCLGLLAPYSGLNASFSTSMPRPGGLAVISQSGALCTAMLDWAQDRKVGFSGVVSVGNMVDIGFGDLIDYYSADANTSALLLYIESVTDPRHFLAAAQICSRGKPIFALKAGRFAESSLAAASHTGAMAGVDGVYDAAFRRAGIERVNSFEDLCNCAVLVNHSLSAVGSRLAILTNAGGPGIMASDAWLAEHGQLAKLSQNTVDALNIVLPSQWSHGNPIDILGDAGADRFSAALSIVATDPGVDALIVILTPQSMTHPTAIACALAACPKLNRKPVLAVWMGGPAVRRGRDVLEAAHIPVYSTAEEAANALSHLMSAVKLREESSLHSREPSSTTGDISPVSSVERLQTKWHQELIRCPGLLGEALSKQMLGDFGIPVASTRVARSEEEAVNLALECGFPAVLKIVSPDLSHKSDVGGVELNLVNSEAVKLAYHRIIDTVSQLRPLAQLEGISVQAMVPLDHGIELLLGSTIDPIFGPVIMVGSGGITTELQHDVAMQLLPLNANRILSMLAELRIFPLLKGFRGRPGVDLQQLTDVILRFSQMVEALPELQAVEINPLLATANDVIALDARVISRSTPSRVDKSPVPCNQSTTGNMKGSRTACKLS